MGSLGEDYPSKSEFCFMETLTISYLITESRILSDYRKLSLVLQPFHLNPNIFLIVSNIILLNNRNSTRLKISRVKI